MLSFDMVVLSLDDECMQKSKPMKRGYLYTEQIGFRIEPELKSEIKDLDRQGYDMPEIIREAIRQAVRETKESPPKAS